MSSLTQPLKWHGGKFYLRKWIIGLMPPHLHYVEPFFGGGGILLARDPQRNWKASGDERLPAWEKGCSEVANDIHGELTNFWRVLQSQDDFREFQHRVALIPFSEVEFDNALQETRALNPTSGESRSKTGLRTKSSLSDCPSTDIADDAVSRAVRFFILARQSRQGLMKDFATLSRNRTRGLINEQANAWLGVIEGLPEVHARLRSVVILNQDACDVIRKQDGQSTLFYCDPPYLHETRSTTGEYAHEMSEADHERLLDVLSGIEGRFMLSGYPSELYAERQERHGWNCHEYLIDNKAAAGKTKEMKTECLWCNF